jgi:pyruvate dehydrogenase E2 component (dihydrolipoamide acetyltransferase)
MAMQTIIMPKMGDAMEEGTLVRWLKQEGEPVKEGEPIAEIATDKATIELEAPASGILRGIRVPEGATVPINTPLAYILTEGETLPEESKRDGATPAPAAAPQVVAPPSEVKAAYAPAAEERIKASPLARKIAQEHGIDLRLLQGTGPQGRIVERDVLAYLEKMRPPAPAPAAAPPVPPTPAPAGAARTEPLNRLRQITAQRTTEASRPSLTSTSRWRSTWRRHWLSVQNSTAWRKVSASA